MSTKKRSKVWQLFEPVVAGESAKCTVCDVVLRTSGGSTSSLASHLATNHIDEWNAVSSDVEAEEGSVIEIPLRGRMRPSSSTVKKRKSHVWEYCVPSKEFRETAECKLCGAMLKTSGGTTTSLTRHLMSSHQIFKEGGNTSKTDADNDDEDTMVVSEGEHDEGDIRNEGKAISEEEDSRNSGSESVPLATLPNRRSHVWKYFSKTSVKDKAKCKFCGVFLSSANGTTSTLARHLTSKHNISGEAVKEVQHLEEGENEDVIIEGDPNSNDGLKREGSITLPNRRSHVWKYFARSSIKKKAKCKICGVFLSAVNNTSTLAKHLMNRHNISGEALVSRRMQEVGMQDEVEVDNNDTRNQHIGEGENEDVIIEGDPNSNMGLKREGFITLPYRRSHVWKYFARTSIKNKAKCQICGVCLSSVNNTSTLARHLWSKHKISGEAVKEVGMQDEVQADTLDAEVRNEDQGGDHVALNSEENMSVDSSDEEMWTPASKKKKPKQKSHVWKYFVKQNKEKSKCKLCGNLNSSKNGSTSTLARHLQFIHNITVSRTGTGNGRLKLVIKSDAHKSIGSSEIRENEEIDGDMQNISTEEYGFENQLSEEEEDADRKSYRSARRRRRPEYVNNTSMEDKCFVCHSGFNSNSVPACNQEEYHFLFKDMLQIPIGKTRDYLDQLEKPEKWIGLCNSCKTLVREGLSARTKIMHLQLQLEKYQRQILKKITTKQLNDSSKYNYPRKQRQIVEDITKFVSLGAYTVLNYEDEVDIDNRNVDDGEQENFISDDEYAIGGVTNPSKAHGSPQSSSEKIDMNSDEEMGAHNVIVSKLKRCVSSQYCFQCPNCPKVKGYPLAKFVMHLSIHQRRPYQCTMCSEFLPADEDLQDRHWNEKHISSELPAGANKFVQVKLCFGRIWKCDSCLDGFFSEEDRDQHEIRCIPRDQQRLRSSLSLTRQKPHVCKLCDLRFRNVAEWRIHRALNHPEIDSKSCYYCEETFYETTVEGWEARHEQKMQDHMATEHLSKRMYIDCESCGLVFDCGREHKEHMTLKHEIPSSEMYVCIVCGINYTDLIALRRHMSVVHFQSALSVCGMCGVSFLKLELLQHHEFLSHGTLPEGRQVLSCPKEGCTFQAIFKEKMRRHVLRAHDQPANIRTTFTCRFCRKAFKDRISLKAHLEIHTNKERKPYQCEICGQAFAARGYLRTHKQLKHEENAGLKYKRNRRGNRKRKTEEEEETPPTGSPGSSQAIVTAMLININNCDITGTTSTTK